MFFLKCRTPEGLRHIGDSSLNHDNTPAGERESTGMEDTVWDVRITFKDHGDALEASGI